MALDDARIDGIYSMQNGIEGLLREDIVDLRQQPTSLWHQLLYAPSAALGSCRYKLKDEDPARAVEILHRYNIRYVLYIGGNDSADTAHRLAQAARQSGYELQTISVPKTIDNDLPFTDHCPGYGSAARFIAQATIDSTMNTISIPGHYPVKIIEIMGRDAGWLTASSALGKRDDVDPPHIILPPEHAFDADTFLAEVEAVHRRLGYVVIAVAETVRDAKGQALGAIGQVGTDAFQHPLLGGAGQSLVDLVTKQLKLRARFDKPGDLQRMSSVHTSSVDRDEAYLVGQMGTKALLAGESDKMVTLVRHNEPHYHCITGLAELSQVANQQFLMPQNYMNDTKTMVTQAFLDYARPLIGEPLNTYPTLEKVRVQR